MGAKALLGEIIVTGHYYMYWYLNVCAAFVKDIKNLTNCCTA